MKMILPLLLLPFFLNNFILSISIFSSIIMLFITKTLENKDYISLNNLFNMDLLSFSMILLSLFSCFLIFISTSNFWLISPTISSILLILIFTFSLSNMFSFYIMFETVLIPTFFLITMNGKQPERLQAGIYLIIYTITASLPLMLGILYYKKYSEILFSITLNFEFNLAMIFILAFMVKLPMFFLHLWLPKAHVEAPLEGSMILAAVLLKLGGYGLIRFIPLILQKLSMFSTWFISISLIGATATSMNCTRQKDMKSLIAYSSVAHMGLVLASLMTFNYIGLTGAIIMMIAHGISSSALFFLVNLIYSKYHSRNIMSFKGLISIFPNLTLWWFLFLAINISAPPTINTMSEIFIISSLLNSSYLTLILMFFASIMTTLFSINMFINISHNKTEMKFSEESYSKSFLSLFIHITPLILILSKMETMNL